MPSLFQNVKRSLGQAVSEIAAPSLHELAVEQLFEPTIGWLPEDNYSLRPPQTGAVNVSPISSPDQTSVALLSALPPVACLVQIEPIVLLPFPLLRESDTQELRAELKASTAPNRFHRLAKTQSVSRNLHRALGTLSPLRTEDCLAVLLARLVVSEDLHKPLGRPARSDGKRYSAEVQAPEETLAPESLQTPPLAFVGGGLGNRKAFDQARGGGNQRVTRGMNVWDLLLPLLQRPINLDLGTVVDVPSNLYAFQIKGVEFLVETQSALLGDDMGTGKTVQTAVALRMLFQTAKIRTALIACPLSVIPNWDRELAKWAGNLVVTVVRGNKEHRETCWRQPAHVWLTTYDTLRNDFENVLTLRKGGFDLVALDEAQRIKNWNSGITRAVRQLRATYRWGLRACLKTQIYSTNKISIFVCTM
jgi:hypothetical protein